jgi:pimeloyl-ACP methyl ester carboxylesterase
MEEVVKNRLQLKKKKLPDPWRPPNGLFSCVGRVWQWQKYNPSHRQALLNRETTIVDAAGFLEGGPEGIFLSPSSSKGRRFRGWSSIHAYYYQNFLFSLEATANITGSPERPSEQIPDEELPHYLRLLADNQFPKQLTRFLDINGISHCRMSMGKIRNVFLKNIMPAYAFGYNWLDSNAESAKALVAIIPQIINYYNQAKSPSGDILFICNDVILVTHSMGGLVARAAAKLAPKGIIKGIFHAVMPAVGTPDAYRSMVAGNTLTVEMRTFPTDCYYNAGSILMGLTAQETTPVMAHSPGCLELLPSKEYPAKWLMAGFAREGGKSDELFSLPVDDPYEEIYLQENAWYRLVDPNLLDPCGIFKDKKTVSPWSSYKDSIQMANEFHKFLKEPHSIPTYACYGNDKKYPTFGAMKWSLVHGSKIIHATRDRVKAATFHCDLNGGEYRIAESPAVNFNDHTSLLRFHVQKQDTSGDSTVSWQSGSAPGSTWLKGRIWPLTGVKHPKAFEEDSVRLLTLWAICQFVTGTK